MAKFTIKALIFATLVCFVIDNPTAAAGGTTADNDEGDEAVEPSTPAAPSSTPPSLMNRVMNNVKQQTVETLDGAAGSGAGTVMLNRFGQPPKGSVTVTGGGSARVTENRLVTDDALGRLQKTKGRTVAAAKKMVDETVHKLQSTVDEIKRTVSGDDGDDAGGDQRISTALDSLLRAVGAESKAVFEYASDVVNETADRAKAAVEKAKLQKQRRDGSGKMAK